MPEDVPWNQMNDYNVKLGDCNDYLKTHIKFQYESLVSNLFFNKMFIYIEEVNNQKQEFNYEFWKKIHNTLLKKFGLKTKISLGSIKEISNIYSSYEEALTVLKLSDKNIDIHQESTTCSLDIKIFSEMCDQLLNQFINRNKKAFDTFEEIKNLYLTSISSGFKILAVEYNILELLIQLYGVCKTSQVYDINVVNEKIYIQEYLSNSSIDKLNYFEERLKTLFEDYNTAQSYNYSEITQSVLNIIQNSYKEDLSLDATSQIVNVTPQYLSKLFKEETGKSFKELIIDLRMKEAKGLLKESKLSIRDVAYAVGYNDPNYFIRIFKKNTGLTPKEYQRVIE